MASTYDLHPLQYRNYINAGGITQNGAALKIQRVWKKYILNKKLKRTTDRFFSWIGF